jgi:hypothetical protein
MVGLHDAKMSANGIHISEENYESTADTTSASDAKNLGATPVGTTEKEISQCDADDDAPVYLTGARFWLITISQVHPNPDSIRISFVSDKFAD